MSRGPGTSHSAIFEYWKDKRITENGDVISDRTFTLLDAIDVVNDWAEPVCWCCGDLMNPLDTDDNPKYDTLLRKNNISGIYRLKTVKSHLQRCHIVPDALGGEDVPENLFLLCRHCHGEAPDIGDRHGFLKWIYDQRRYGGYVQTMVREVMDRLETEGMDLADISIPELETNLKDIKCSAHSGRMKRSSMVYKLLLAAKQSAVYTGENS